MIRNVIKVIIPLILILVIVGGHAAENLSFADTALLMPPRQNRITDIGYIRHPNSSEWYANLGWEWDIGNFPPEAEDRYIILGLNEIARGTGELYPDAMTIPLPGGATSFGFNEYTPEGIQHGTIYEAYLRASYRYNTPHGQYTITSQKSNPAKFLTGLHVSVELIPGTNNIKIKWDDVWDTRGRINYRILISDTKGFTQPPPIPDIVASEIGEPGSAVTINREERKLEYIYTYAMPGREYSIKVVPLPGADVAYATADEIEAVTIKTDILLKAQKVGYNNEGDVIWNLFWNPIVKGSTYTRVDYELYRYVNNEPQAHLFRLIPEIDNYQITIKKNDPNSYSFKIDAKAYVQGSEAPIEFRSNNRVTLKEQIPQYPQAPEIVDSFPDADPEPLNYDDLLTSTQAAVLWRAPYTGEGLIDNEVTYDIYLVEDIEDVSSPPSNFKIASDLSMGEANQVRSKLTGEIIGYRYNVQGLTSNSTYYFVIYAKKNYLVESPDSGFMITMPYVSKQAVKVIITKPDTGADRPVAPSSPPFAVKPGENSITFNKASFVLEKKWYALFDAGTKRWEQVSYNDYITNELLEPGDDGYENKRIGMIVDYLPGWTVIPHVVKYDDAINAIRLRNNRDEDYITYSDLSQPDIKAFEISQQSVPVPNIPDDESQVFGFDITGLTHNTAYIVWLTIANQNGTASDPSDPIIITTPPDIPDRPVTPTVPDDLKGIAADTFVDLFWTCTEGMEYEIRGATSDVLESAAITRHVTYEEIYKNTFFRVDGLESDTVYYFWIKAISVGGQGQVIESEYSNPLVIRTQAHKPPAPPTGFGVKSGADGVTEKSITYIWNELDGMSYILEFSDNADFEDSQSITVTGDTYTAAGLISNRRYYARLYAVDISTNLRSEPTRTIMVVTNKSRDEYDSGFDLNEPVTGDGLDIPLKLENGIWTISSLEANGHVLAERIRSQHGAIVKLDLSQPPGKTTTIRLELSAVVMEALSDMKKEMYVILPWGRYTIRPGTFQTDEYYRQKIRNNNIAFRLESVSPASQYRPAATMRIMSAITDLRFSYLQGNYPIQDLTRSIRVELPIANLTGYARGHIKTFSYDSYRGWYALPTVTDYENGQVAGELGKPGPVTAATEGVRPDSTVPAYVTESISKIQSVFELKSIKGKNINYNGGISQKDILKLLLDVIPAEYTDSTLARDAVSAGLIRSMNDAPDTLSRRDKAVDMLVSLYRFKTRESAAPEHPQIWSYCKDLTKVDQSSLSAYRFALENGIIRGDGTGLTYPDKTITLGDFLVMLERTLRLCGEL